MPRPLPVPSLAVVIPTYNGAATIGDALDSLAAQSRPPDQVVIVDDGSATAPPTWPRRTPSAPP